MTFRGDSAEYPRELFEVEVLRRRVQRNGNGEAGKLERWATKERVRERRWTAGDPRIREQGRSRAEVQKWATKSWGAER